MVFSCSDIKEDLSSFIDNELAEHEQSVYIAHLATCVTCKQEHDNFKHVGKLLQGSYTSIQETAPDIWQSVLPKMPSICECICADLSAYLDGELIASAKEGVDLHLEQCARCLSKFNQLSSVNSLLAKGLAIPDKTEVDIWSGVKSRLNDDCLLIRSELSSFIDKEVATLRHRSITMHLTECAECKDEFNSLSQAGDVIRSYYQPELPADFDLWSSLQSRLNVLPFEAKEKKKRSNNIAARRLYAVAATVFAGVAASIMFLTYVQTPPNPPVQPTTAEAYLLDQSLGEPVDVAEAAVYNHAP